MNIENSCNRDQVHVFRIGGNVIDGPKLIAKHRHHVRVAAEIPVRGAVLLQDLAMASLTALGGGKSMSATERGMTPGSR